MINVIDIYRHLHRHPELSGCEAQTSEYIFSALSSVGYSPKRVGNNGVFADLIVSNDSPWLIFRADCDALPIEEKSGLEFSSKNPSVMHACGHDAHSAMLLKAAADLFGESLNYNIRFIFQPAEETTKGAADLISNGVMPPNAVAVLGMHLWPGVEFGRLATRPGSLMASSDVFKIYCDGKSAHCGQRDKGADALKTAVQIANEFPTIEALSEGDGTVLFCGSLHGGSSHNIVSDEAYIWGTLRTFSQETRSKIKEKLKSTCEFYGSLNSVETQIVWDGGCPSINNDNKLIALLKENFPNMNICATPTLAAEDFACYQELCAGVMLWLGMGDVPSLHSNNFFVPEEILPIGVDTWKKLAHLLFEEKVG